MWRVARAGADPAAPADPCADCRDDRQMDMSNRVCVRRIVERKCKWRERGEAMGKA